MTDQVVFLVSIFSKPFDEVTFDDIDAYCQEKHLETATLDYKKNVPRDLTKHIAAMSNTLGGTIIIGVEEDSRTGLPLRWAGIDPAGKPVDQVYQFIANVKPYPSCGVRMTDARNGKVFVLVEVLEGDATPYYPVNDASIVWLRTGNISTPLKSAEPDAIDVMYGKNTKALAARQANVARAELLAEGALAIAPKPNVSSPPAKTRILRPGRRTGLGDALYWDRMAIVLQPHFPRRELITARDIRAKASEFRVSSKGQFAGNGPFPEMNLRPGPDCVYHFDFDYRGAAHCDQLTSDGMLYRAREGLLRSADGTTRLYMEHIVESLFVFLKSAQEFYRTVDYHGLVDGRLALLDVRQATVFPIATVGSQRFMFDDDLPKLPLANYGWELRLDTHDLGDDVRLQDYFLDLVGRMYWDLGLGDTKVADGVREWLRQAGRLAE